MCFLRSQHFRCRDHLYCAALQISVDGVWIQQKPLYVSFLLPCVPRVFDFPVLHRLLLWRKHLTILNWLIKWLNLYLTSLTKCSSTCMQLEISLFLSSLSLNLRLWTEKAPLPLPFCLYKCWCWSSFPSMWPTSLSFYHVLLKPQPLPKCL